MSTMDELARRVREERKRRHMTQQQLADAAGVYKGTVSNFETRKRDPQAQNLRSILQVLDMLDEDPGDDIAEATRGEWEPDIQFFLDVLGLYLDAQEEPAERAAVMRDLSAWLLERRRRRV